MGWLPADVVLAIAAHLDAHDVCTLACVSRELRRSLASASLSFTAAGTAHIRFEERELDCGAAETALKAFLERNASRVKALDIPTFSWDWHYQGEDSNFLSHATRLQSLEASLYLDERGVLPQSLTGLTYCGWSGNDPEIFNWTPFKRLASLRELHLYLNASKKRNSWPGRLELDTTEASCFSRLLDLRICGAEKILNLYLGAGLRLPSLTCLHLWSINPGVEDYLKTIDWGAALPNLLSLRIRCAQFPEPLISLPPMLRSLELCNINCSDFRECVHLKQLKVDGRRQLRDCDTVLCPASLEVLVVLFRGYIRLGKPLPRGLRIVVNAATGIDFAGSRPSMFARPTVSQVQPDDIATASWYNYCDPFDFDSMPAALLHGQGSDEFWDCSACIEGMVRDELK